jgi:hypothetical protein
MHEVTRLLDATAAGDCRAAANLLPLVYVELRWLPDLKSANVMVGAFGDDGTCQVE